MTTQTINIEKSGSPIARLVLLAATLSWGLLGCNPDTWNKTFGGVNEEWGRSVQQTTDGGYIVGGAYTDGRWDMLLVRTDKDGNELWTEILGEALEDEFGECVWQTADGGFIIVGHIGTSAVDNDGLAIRTDASGNELWTMTYGGEDEDELFAVQQTTDGGFALAGVTKSSGAGSWDGWLIKTDANGKVVWSKTYGGSSRELFASVQQTADGGYILAGDTASSGPLSNNAWLVKTDASGNQLWDQVFGGDSLDFASSVQQTADGGYILAGETASSGAGNRDAWLIRTDAAGNDLWSKTFGGPESDSADSVQQTAFGGYILAGRTKSYGSGDNDVWLIKTDASGNEIWNRVYGGVAWDVAHAVQQTTDLGYIVAGQTTSYGAGASDVLLIKTDFNGNAPSAPSP